MCNQRIHHHTCGHILNHPLTCQTPTPGYMHQPTLQPIIYFTPCPACTYSSFPQYHPQPPPYWLHDLFIPPHTQVDTRWGLQNGTWRPVVYYHSTGGRGGGGGWNTIHGQDRGDLPPGWTRDGGFISGSVQNGTGMDMTEHTLGLPLGSGADDDENVEVGIEDVNAGSGTQDIADGPYVDFGERDSITSTAATVNTTPPDVADSEPNTSTTAVQGVDVDAASGVGDGSSQPAHTSNPSSAHPHPHPPQPSIETDSANNEDDQRSAIATKKKGEKRAEQKAKSKKEAGRLKLTFKVPTPKGDVDVSVDGGSATGLRLESGPF